MGKMEIFRFEMILARIIVILFIFGDSIKCSKNNALQTNHNQFIRMPCRLHLIAVLKNALIAIAAQTVILAFRTGPIKMVGHSFVTFSHFHKLTRIRLEVKMQYFKCVCVNTNCKLNGRTDTDGWMDERTIARFDCIYSGLIWTSICAKQQVSVDKIEQNAVIIFDCHCKWLAFVDFKSIHWDQFSHVPRAWESALTMA